VGRPSTNHELSIPEDGTQGNQHEGFDSGPFPADPDAWVRVEALAAFAFFAEEKDRAKLMDMRMDPNEDVQMYSRNALSRIKPGKAAD
jgi:HEAT repeat protein